MKKMGIIAAAVIIAFSFTTGVNGEVPTGIYGTCGCSNEEERSFGLVLNPDNSFHYFDRMQEIDVTGTWKAVDDFILLDSENSMNIAMKWKKDKHHNCLESRRGLTFTRICHVETCN